MDGRWSASEVEPMMQETCGALLAERRPVSMRLHLGLVAAPFTLRDARRPARDQIVILSEIS